MSIKGHINSVFNVSISVKKIQSKIPFASRLTFVLISLFTS